MNKYTDFLSNKHIRFNPCGLEPQRNNEQLFDWQRAVTDWGVRKGRAALFEDCGLGKTPQQLEWASEIAAQTRRPVLIYAPLAVAAQTQREGRKFGIDVNIAEMQVDIRQGVNITNYEKLDHFDPAAFSGLVLDESSILKSYMGKTKRLICDKYAQTPYKLACTATPAPNDLMELLNHAEFLGIMRSSEALSVWFIADQKESGKYKLKGHAEKDFWQWVASWAVCIEKPSDIGYPDDGYILPTLEEIDEIITVDERSDNPLEEGFLRNIDLSATGFYAEKSRTVKQRAARCAEIVNQADEQYMIWCDTNEEADELKRMIPGAVEVRGSDKTERKERIALEFIDGVHRVMISKPTIFGYGLNFQNCRNCVFCGLNYSYESYYQAVRRFHRFGQALPVKVSRVIGSTERNILDVINRKQNQKTDMAESMAQAMRDIQTNNIKGHAFKLDLSRQIIEIPKWVRSEAS